MIVSELETSRPLRLAVTGASKAYGTVQALKSADFELRAGEVMGLVGENGAGKSTLVKIICGVTRRDGGTIEVDGASVDLGSTVRAEQAGIAVVQQELSVVPSLTVAENIFLGQPSAPRIYGRRGIGKLARSHLEIVGLDHLDPHSPADRLSVAERQMLEIARVVSRNAQIIMLDEPTASLSDEDIARVRSVVLRLASEGRSVVYITHRLGEIFDFVDRVTVFRDGESQPPVNVTELAPDELVGRMLGRPLEQMFPSKASSFGECALEVRDLSTNGLPDPLSISVRRGEILGLAGQLGSGAPELLRGISGTQPAEYSELTVDGVPVRVRNPSEALKRGIAYCSGDRKYDGFFASRSVAENLTAPALASVSRLGLLSRRSERRLAERLGTLMQVVTGRMQARISTLSGGNQQKVVLGKWLGTEPRVLLIDEPTRGVDVGARAEIYGHLRRLAEEGLAIIFASSDMHEVEGLADSIVTFYRGRIVATHDAIEVNQEQLILEITHPVGSAA